MPTLHRRPIVLRVSKGPFGIFIRIHDAGQHELLLVIEAGNALRLSWALASAGSNMAANTAMIAITTNSSINVKPAEA